MTKTAVAVLALPLAAALSVMHVRMVAFSYREGFQAGMDKTLIDLASAIRGGLDDAASA